MKRSCKNINITDWKTVLPWVSECIERHYKRYDFKHLLKSVGKMRSEEYAALLSGDKTVLRQPEERIAEEAAERITERDLQTAPVHIREKLDRSTMKIRLIGCEPAMRQVFDYIAVRGSQEIWDRRIVPYQVSSITGRGPVYGISKICRWLKKDDRAARWATKHKHRYSRQCRYHVKLDIVHCYQSMRPEHFMGLFARDCGNTDLIWLWDTLLNSCHAALPDGTIYNGFMIGALTSQQACQYIMSFAYRHTMDLHRSKRGRKHKLVSHMILHMDDMLLFSASRRDLKSAAQSLTRFLRSSFDLTVKPDWQICSTKLTPIDMMGYKVYTDGEVSVRPRIFLRARRIALRALRHGGISFRQSQRLCSYKGYFLPKHSRFCLRTGRPLNRLRLGRLFGLAASVISRRSRHAAFA